VCVCVCVCVCARARACCKPICRGGETCSMLPGSLVYEMLASEAYYLNLANAGFSLSRSTTGLIIAVSAYSDKVSAVVDSLTQLIKSLVSGTTPVNENTFSLVKTAMLQGLENYQSAQPYQSAFGFIDAFLRKNSFLPQEKIETAKNATSVMLTQFIPQIFAAGIVESLSYGNVDEVMALQSTDKVLSLMTDSLPRVDPATRQKIIKLQGEAIFQTRAYNSEPNSAFVAFFQVEKTTDRRNKVMSSLFGTFVREPFFDQLRTKETLGYTVSAWATSRLGVSFLAFLVQGTKKPANEQEMRVEAFIAALGAPDGKVMNMLTTTFNQLKSTLKADYEERPLSMEGAFGPVWQTIESENYDFSWKTENIATLETITKDGFVAFYQDYLQVGGKFRHKFSCEIFGENHTVSVPTGDAFLHSSVLDDFTTRAQWQQNEKYF